MKGVTLIDGNASGASHIFARRETCQHKRVALEHQISGSRYALTPIVSSRATFPSTLLTLKGERR
jgi:hypothetical protein